MGGKGRARIRAGIRENRARREILAESGARGGGDGKENPELVRARIAALQSEL